MATNLTPPITLRVEPGVKEHLIKIAKIEDRSVSATMRRILSQYIEATKDKYGIQTTA